jgi:hypothetical protein
MVMPRMGPEDQLADGRHVVLVLRLVLNRRAEVEYGELLDAGAKRVAIVGSLQDIAGAIARWLEEQARGARETGKHT